jgi:transcriptional regulator with XRE-family HTH domain
MSDELANWLNEKVKEVGSARELARRAGVSHTTVSEVMSGVRKPTFEFCDAVARALHVSPERIFRLAGLLPKRPERNEMIDDILWHFDRMSPEQQRSFLRNVERDTDEKDARSDAALFPPSPDTGTAGI